MSNYSVSRKSEDSKLDFKFETPDFDVAEKMFWSAVNSSREIIGDYTISFMKYNLDTEHELFLFKKEYE